MGDLDGFCGNEQSDERRPMECPEGYSIDEDRIPIVMKKRILTQLITVAAGMALPLSVIAQDFGKETNSGNLEGRSGTSGSATQNSQGSGSYSSGGTFSGDAALSAGQSENFKGGIIVHDGAAYVIHRLQNEMALPDGSKVQPDGTVLEKDGSTRSIGSGQALSLDGRVVGAPFGTEGKSPQSDSTGIYSSPNTPGASTGVGAPGGTTDPQTTTPDPGVPPTTGTPSEEIGGSGSVKDPLDLGNNTDSNPAGQDNESGNSSGGLGTEPTQY